MTLDMQMKKKSGISQRSLLRFLHQHKFHPYRMPLHQDLYGNDYLKRVNFCNWIRRKMRTDVSFLSHVNRHNMHYWANENPRWMITVPFQHSWSVNCWCGIVGDHVIRSYFFEGRLTGEVYAKFLQNVLPQLMEDVLLSCCHRVKPWQVTSIERNWCVWGEHWRRNGYSTMRYTTKLSSSMTVLGHMSGDLSRHTWKRWNRRSYPTAVLSRRCSFRLPFVTTDGTRPDTSEFPLLWKSQIMDRFVDRFERRIVFLRWYPKISSKMKKSSG